jgi:hypothetical protein
MAMRCFHWPVRKPFCVEFPDPLETAKQSPSLTLHWRGKWTRQPALSRPTEGFGPDLEFRLNSGFSEVLLKADVPETMNFDRGTFTRSACFLGFARHLEL